MDSAFSKGADLWILPDIEHSSWRWSLEWSVNFQIAKSLIHPSPEIPPSAMEKIESLEAQEFTELKLPKSPWTLISVDGLLPAKWLVYSHKISKEALEKELDRLWTGLGKPTVRFFPSKVWTTEALKSLKSECAHASTTETIDGDHK